MIRFDKKLFVRTPENDYDDVMTYRYGKFVNVTYREKTFINNDGSKDVRLFLDAEIADERIKDWDEKHKITSSYLMEKPRRMYHGVRRSKYKAKEFIKMCDYLERLLNCNDEFLFHSINHAIDSDNFCSF